jgi:ketosteroid isomerase-like protein
VSLFQAIGLIVTLVAVLGYLNHRLLRLPEPVGTAAAGLVVSLIVAAAGIVHPQLAEGAAQMLAHVDFASLVFNGLLGLLLFAGSLHISWSEIAVERWSIGVLATVGVLLSMLLVGIGFYYASRWLGFPVPFLWCLLFGALISPTDPIAVMSVLRAIDVPKRIETKLAGESLFNDGTGVVAFITLLWIAAAADAPTAGDIATLLGLEVVGGVAVGLAVGFGGFLLLRTIDSYPTEILITLAMATGGYALAEALHGSGPIAVVLMGLVTGNQGRERAMSLGQRGAAARADAEAHARVAAHRQDHDLGRFARGHLGGARVVAARGLCPRDDHRCNVRRGHLQHPRAGADARRPAAAMGHRGEVMGAMSRAMVLVPLLAACAGLPQGGDRAAIERQVGERERAFAKTMADRDHAAFATFVSEEAVFFTGPSPLRGRAAVAEGWKRFYTAQDAPFSWEPDEVQALDSGTLALTSGPVRNAQSKLVARFTSIWRREADGVWRVIFDRGNEVCDCAK